MLLTYCIPCEFITLIQYDSIFIVDETRFSAVVNEAHNDTDEGTEQDKEHDKDFREIYQGVTKRGMNNEDLIENYYLYVLYTCQTLGNGYIWTPITVILYLDKVVI